MIAFFSTKTSIKRLRKFCESISIEFDSISDDQQLLDVMSTIRHKDRGVVGALDYYGRGADIRFRLDSFVIIGFLPQKYDYVRQMIGRSSRTLG